MNFSNNRAEKNLLSGFGFYKTLNLHRGRARGGVGLYTRQLHADQHVAAVASFSGSPEREINTRG